MLYSHKNNFSDTFFNFIESTSQLISSQFLRQSPLDYVSINTVEGEHNVVLDDGSLLTAIRIDGATSAIYVEEYITIVNKVESLLKAYLDDGNHTFTFYFSLDTDKVEDELERVYGRDARATYDRIGFLDDSLIDEQVQVMKNFCHVERNFLVVKTSLHNLTQSEKQELEKLRIKLAEGKLRMRDAQSLSMGVEHYHHRHTSVVNEIIAELHNLNILSRPLTKHEYIYELRNAYDAAFTDSSWKPVLPGDEYNLSIAEEMGADFSNFGIPKLSTQLIPRMMDITHHNMAHIGDTVYAPLSVEYVAHDPQMFSKFLRAMKKDNIPFRIAFDVSANGMKLFGFKEFLASILASTPGAQDNKYISETKSQMQKLADKGEEIVQLRVMLCTWAYNNDVGLAASRREQMAKKLQAWGVTKPAEAEADVAESIMSSIPGLTRGNVAKPLPSPLHDVAKCLPLMQPASVWEKGSRLYRTPHGKIMPQMPMSSKQTSHVKCVLGPMGFGKSAELASDNMALIENPQNNELPYIRGLDIGPSSRGFVEMVRSNLPESRKHEAIYKRLQNTADDAINAFDTPIGLRFPLSNHKATLQNILALLVMPDDGSAPYEGTLDALERLITIAYLKRSERATMAPYMPGKDKDVDDALNKHAFAEKVQRKKVFWWDVVDFLYLNDDLKNATLAQRWAVPDLPFVINQCGDARLQQELNEIKVPTGEMILTYVRRKLTSALNKYPIIGSRTKFDIANAKIVSLDLDDVTKGTGSEARCRTALMYCLAFHVLTTDMYKGDDHLKEMQGEVGIFNVDYRIHHQADIARLQRILKRFFSDEVHRGREIELFVKQLITMVLEGRKWGVDVTLASQLPNAFPQEIKDLATSIIILGAGNTKNADIIVQEFGLNDAMEYHLKNSMRKPSALGATCIAIFATESATVQHILYSTKGAEFLWGINSVRSDSYVRNKLANLIGETNARKLLVKRFPSGTIAQEIENRLRLLVEDTSDSDFSEDAILNVVPENESVLDEIIRDNERYFNTYALAA